MIIFQPFTRWRARRQLARLSPEQAAEALRLLIAADVETDSQIMSEIALKAAEGAEGTGRTLLLKIARVYAEGREVKFGTFPVTLLRDGESPELVLAVEDAFSSSKEQ